MTIRFSAVKGVPMGKLRIIVITLVLIGIATVAYAFPFSVIIAVPFPEAASLLMLGTGMIAVANYVRRISAK